MYKNSAFISAGSSCPEKSLNAISDKLVFFLVGFVTYTCINRPMELNEPRFGLRMLLTVRLSSQLILY